MPLKARLAKYDADLVPFVLAMWSNSRQRMECTLESKPRRLRTIEVLGAREVCRMWHN
jgi:hypothetical protein